MDKKILKVPKTCGQCRFIGAYTHGPWSRDPHYCCELIFDLYSQDYRVKKDTRDEECPLVNLVIVNDEEETN